MDYSPQESIRALFKAVREHNLPETATILSTLQPEHLRDALYKAISDDDTEVAGKVLQHMEPAELNKYDSNGETPLIYAAHFSYKGTAMLELLLKAGANPLLADTNHLTAAVHAQEHVHDTGLRLQLRVKEKEPAPAELQSTEERWLAKNKEKPNAFELLVQAEAEWRANHPETEQIKQMKHQTWLLFESINSANISGMEDAIRAAVRDGADINYVVPKESKYYSNYTPLTFAIQTGVIAAVPILLELGADRNLPDGVGRLPLVQTLKRKDSYLPPAEAPELENKPPVAEDKDSEQKSPGVLSDSYNPRAEGHARKEPKFAPAQIDPEAAIRARHLFRILLDGKADPTKREENGPGIIELLATSKTSIRDYVQNLKSHGFDFETQGRDGMNLLVQTVHYGTPENLKEILEVGANPFATHKNKPILEIALNDLGRKDMAHILRDAQDAVSQGQHQQHKDDLRSQLEEKERRIALLEQQLAAAKNPKVPTMC